MSAWIILTVRRSREFAVRDTLHELRIPAFVPIEFRWRKAVRGRPPQSRRAPLIPGYVFARYAGRWTELRDVDHLYGCIYAVGHGAGEWRPATLTSEQADTVVAMSTPAADPASAALSVGDRVRVALGRAHDPAALVGVVDTIDRGRAIAIIDLCGKPHRVRLPDGAVKVEPA